MTPEDLVQPFESKEEAIKCIADVYASILEVNRLRFIFETLEDIKFIFGKKVLMGLPLTYYVAAGLEILGLAGNMLEDEDWQKMEEERRTIGDYLTRRRDRYLRQAGNDYSSNVVPLGEDDYPALPHAEWRMRMVKGFDKTISIFVKESESANAGELLLD